MSPTIQFPTGKPPGDDHIISQAPFRLRWGDWRTTRIIQVHVAAAAVYEDQRQECLEQGRDPSAHMPVHFSLEDSLHLTALALLRHRQDAQALQDVTYLSLLMEALINTPCAILRTDLIRRVYQEVEAYSQRLSLRWQGRGSQFMLPLNQDAQDANKLARVLGPLDNLQEFFAALKGLAQERHTALATGYVFYYPRLTSL